MLSHLAEVIDLVLVPSVEEVGKALEWILDVFPLKGAYLEEFKADALSKGHTICGPDSHSVLEVDLICDDYTHEGTALILLLDAVKPLSEKVEGVWVCNVIDEHDQVSLSEQFKSDLLEDVLASDVDHV